MLKSKLKQSIRVEGKKEFLKQFVRHLYDGIPLLLVLMVGSYLRAFLFIILNVQTRRLYYLLDLRDYNLNSW